MIGNLKDVGNLIKSDHGYAHYSSEFDNLPFFSMFNCCFYIDEVFSKVSSLVNPPSYLGLMTIYFDEL